MADVAHDSRLHSLNVANGGPDLLRLNSETLDPEYDQAMLNTIHNGETSSLKTVNEQGSAEKKVAQLKSVYEYRSPEKTAVNQKSNSGALASSGMVTGTAKPIRAALTRYQSHLTQLKLAPSSSASPLVTDGPTFTFEQLGEEVNTDSVTGPFRHSPLLPEQLPQMGLTPLSISLSVDQHDGPNQSFVPADASMDQRGYPPEPSLPHSFSTDSTSNPFTNQASALLMTAALNALSQAHASPDPNNPLTSAITVASAQILAAALAQTQSQSTNQHKSPSQYSPQYPYAQSPQYAPSYGALPSQSGYPTRRYRSSSTPVQRDDGQQLPHSTSGLAPRTSPQLPRPSPPPAQRGVHGVASAGLYSSASPAPHIPPTFTDNKAESPKLSNLSSSPTSASSMGMVRVKSLTFSDMQEAGLVPSNGPGNPGAAPAKPETYTPSATYKDFLTRYSSGLEAVQAVREGANVTAGGSYVYGAPASAGEGKESETVVSSSEDLFSGLNDTPGTATGRKSLSRHPAAATSTQQQAPATPPKSLTSHVLSKVESRQMMSVLLDGAENKPKRVTAEPTPPPKSQHYNKLFHTCDPRVFEASFDKSKQSAGSDNSSSAAGGRSPYRSTMAQLVANSPRFVKIHALRPDGGNGGEGSVHSVHSADPLGTGNTAGNDESGDFGGFGEQDEFGLPLQVESTREASSKRQTGNGTTGETAESMFIGGKSTNTMKRPLVRHTSADSSQMDEGEIQDTDKSEKGLDRTYSALSAKSEQSRVEGEFGKSRKEGDFGSTRNGGTSRKDGDFGTGSRMPMGSSTRGMHTSFKFDTSNKRDLVGRETRSMKGQGKLHTTALDFVQDKCLNSIDAKNLKLASLKNRNVLVGWQVSVAFLRVVT
jgi:hypothetical protein